MKNKGLDNIKHPVVTIDKSLDKYNGEIVKQGPTTCQPYYPSLKNILKVFVS